MFGIGKKKVSPVEEKTITTPILKTTILISEDGTDPFVTSEYSEYPHNGLSYDDIANIEAMEYSKDLGIDLRRQINGLEDDTIVYSFKHDTREITIFTLKCFK